MTFNYHILTTGQPCFVHIRRLLSDKLKAAKDGFYLMLHQDINLYLEKNKNEDWRPCSGFRNLNSQTIPDLYPLPNIKDVTFMLHEKIYLDTYHTFQPTHARQKL